MHNDVMCFGLNFNGVQIPSGWKRRFAERVRIAWLDKPRFYVLQGVALNEQTMMRMVEQADNGRRLIHIEERHSAAGPVYGVYTY